MPAPLARPPAGPTPLAAVETTSITAVKALLAAHGLELQATLQAAGQGGDLGAGTPYQIQCVTLPTGRTVWHLQPRAELQKEPSPSLPPSSTDADPAVSGAALQSGDMLGAILSTHPAWRAATASHPPPPLDAPLGPSVDFHPLTLRQWVSHTRRPSSGDSQHVTDDGDGLRAHFDYFHSMADGGDDPRLAVWGVAHPDAPHVMLQASGPSMSIQARASSPAIPCAAYSSQEREMVPPLCGWEVSALFPQGKAAMLAASPERLVAQLTSVLDTRLQTDFFYTFRAFMTPDTLLGLLLARLEWSLGRSEVEGDDMASCAVVRVRTMVLLRFWLLHFFDQDWYGAPALRTRLCDWLNAHTPAPRGAEGVLSALRKTVHSLQEKYGAFPCVRPEGPLSLDPLLPRSALLPKEETTFATPPPLREKRSPLLPKWVARTPSRWEIKPIPRVLPSARTPNLLKGADSTQARKIDLLSFPDALRSHLEECKVPVVSEENLPPPTPSQEKASPASVQPSSPSTRQPSYPSISSSESGRIGDVALEFPLPQDRHPDANQSTSAEPKPMPLRAYVPPSPPSMPGYPGGWLEQLLPQSEGYEEPRTSSPIESLQSLATYTSSARSAAPSGATFGAFMAERSSRGSYQESFAGQSVLPSPPPVPSGLPAPLLREDSVQESVRSTPIAGETNFPSAPSVHSTHLAHSTEGDEPDANPTSLVVPLVDDRSIPDDPDESRTVSLHADKAEPASQQPHDGSNPEDSCVLSPKDVLGPSLAVRRVGRDCSRSRANTVGGGSYEETPSPSAREATEGRPGVSRAGLLQLDGVELASDEEGDAVRRALRQLPGAGDLRKAEYVSSSSSRTSWGESIPCHNAPEVASSLPASSRSLPYGFLTSTLFDDEIALAGCEMVKGFCLDGFESDDNEPGGVADALARLEGIIPQEKRAARARTVEKLLAASARRMGQRSASTRGTDLSANTRDSQHRKDKVRATVGAGAVTQFWDSSRMTGKPDQWSLAPMHRPFILDHRSEDVAGQWCLIEAELFTKVSWLELASGGWRAVHRLPPVDDWEAFYRLRMRRKVEGSSASSDSAMAVIAARFNVVANWIASEIVLTPTPRARAGLVAKFIRIAVRCYELGNLASVVQVICGLQSPWVARLTRTWSLVPQLEKRALRDLGTLASPAHGFRHLRKVCDDLIAQSGLEEHVVSAGLSPLQGDMARLPPSHACVPFAGLLLFDLTEVDLLPSTLSAAEYLPRRTSSPSSCASSSEDIRLPPNWAPTCTLGAEIAAGVIDSVLPSLPASVNAGRELINLFKFRLLGMKIKMALVFQACARAYTVPVHAPLYSRCLKLRCLPAPVLTHLSHMQE